MKVSKTLLQTIAVAVAVVTVSSSCDDIVKPKSKEPSSGEQPFSCPACGMG